MIKQYLKVWKSFSKKLNFIYFKYRKKCDVKQDLDVRGFVYIKNKGKISIGNKFICNSGKNKNPIGGDTVTRLVTRQNGKISIGNNVGISNSTIVSANNIIISDNVLIGGGCKIWDTNFHSLSPIERKSRDEKLIVSKPITLMANSFIGGGSIILPGVTIGKNSIVGAGSVVRKNIPENEIWVGNPACKIGEIF